jgi:ketosteroid isomerase-like protein
MSVAFYEGKAVPVSNKDDREAIEAVHEEYLRVNGEVDHEALPRLWSSDPENWYFNLTGHNYRGLEHWLELWRYYNGRIRAVAPWTSSERVIRVHGDVGWIASIRRGEIEWVGDEPPPPLPHGPFESRSTEVLHREAAGWKVVHAHFSPSSTIPRPAGI